MEFNETTLKMLADEPLGYLPPTFPEAMRQAASLYSKAETDALLDTKASEVELNNAVIAINAEMAGKANIASPVFTGTPAAPTPGTGSNDSTLATTAFTTNKINSVYTAADVLAKLLTVDGPTSGIDAQYLGGFEQSTFARLASPSFTGNPTVPNQLATDISSRIANTQLVEDKINLIFAVNFTPANLLAAIKTVDGAGSGLDADFFRGEAPSAFIKPADLVPYAPLASPAFTGTPTGTTASPGDATTRLATNAFVAAAIAPLAPLASPALTGNPTAPTQLAADNSTRLATTAFVTSKITALTGGPNTFTGLQTFSNGIQVDPTVGVKFGTDDSLTYNDANNTFTFAADASAIAYVEMGAIRLTSTADASLTSTGHAFQAGNTAGANVIIDNNEIMARSNGAAATLGLNLDGGAVSIGAGGLTTTGTSTLSDTTVTTLTASGAVQVNSTLSTTGQVTISNFSPVLRFQDTTVSAYDGRIRLDTNNLYVDGSSDGATYAEVLRFELDTKKAFMSHMELNGSATTEMLRLSHPTAAADPFISLYVAGARMAYIQYSDGTGTGQGFRFYNDVTDDYVYLSNANNVNAFKFWDNSVGNDFPIWHSGNVSLSLVEAAIGYTPANDLVNLTAGNGLTGGGTIAANRTFTLGTPGTISNSSTNSVSATSHTHALDQTYAAVYTGSSSTNTNYPIGTTVSLVGTEVNRAASSTVDYSTGNSTDFVASGGVSLSGTWRGRGRTASGNTLMERTA